MKRPAIGAAVLGALLLTGGAAEAQSNPPSPAAAANQYDLLRGQSAAASSQTRAQARGIFQTAFSAWQAGDFAAAEDAFRQGLDMDPADAAANYYRADCLRRLGNKALALEYDRRALVFGAASPIGARAKIAIDQAAIGADDTVDLVPLTK